MTKKVHVGMFGGENRSDVEREVNKLLSGLKAEQVRDIKISTSSKSREVLVIYEK